MTTERLYIEQHRLKYSINQPMEKTKLFYITLGRNRIKN